MNDTVDGLMGLALIGGLFFAYYIQRRNRRLVREAAERDSTMPVVPEAELAPVEDASAGARLADAATTGEGAPSSSSSPAFGISFSYTALLIGAATHLDSWWGVLWQALFGLMFATALVSTVSPAAYERERAKAPALTRGEHMLMNGIPYVLLPLIGFVLVIPFGWLWGAVVPGVIWLAPFVAGIALEAYEAIRGPTR